MHGEFTRGPCPALKCCQDRRLSRFWNRANVPHTPTLSNA